MISLFLAHSIQDISELFLFLTKSDLSGWYLSGALRKHCSGLDNSFSFSLDRFSFSSGIMYL